MLCRVIKVHPSGYYAWLKQPYSKRHHENQRLLGLVKQSWLENGCVYDYRKVYHDVRDLGESCGPNRVGRLMKGAGLKAQVGYGRKLGPKGGKSSMVAPNQLQRQFDQQQPNQAWVTDITYIRPHEGWLFLAVVIGWSMQPRMETDLVLKALLAAVWRRKPTGKVIVHSDQGSQYSSYDWQDFLKAHNLVPSMSRRGNCHDNAIAESFFQLLKRERIKRKTYSTRDAARQDIFDHIEMFYNSVRQHGYTDNLSPIEFERRYYEELRSV